MNKTAIQSGDPKPLIAYFILAYAISWSIGVPLALANQGIIPTVLPKWSHYLVGYGPMLAALIVTGFRQGLPGLKELGGRMVRWTCPKWWLVGFSPLILGWVTILILNMLTGSEINLSRLGAVNFLPPLSAFGALLLWFFTFGLGEETGWRGYALPRLQSGRSALSATLILGAFWALWHLPMFFYLYEPSMAFGWLFGLFAGAIFLTWLYNSANDSILIVAVWHACFNLVTGSTADTGALPAVLSVIVMLLAVIVVLVYKPKNLMAV
jgi:membrane protease YdiL (CAAX protease family)